MSADGKIACASGDARWVSGPESRRDTHELRHRLAAIAVGIDTVLADDPLLTCRRQDEPGNQPLRVVLDSRLRIPEDCALVRSCAQGEAPLAVATCASVDDPATNAGAKAQRLHARGVEVLHVPQDAVGHVAVRPLLRALGEKGIDSLLVEGGSGIHGAFFDEGKVDEVVVYLAPKVVGGADAPGPVAGAGAAKMAEATALGRPRAHALGGDLKITFAASGAARVADRTPASRNALGAAAHRRKEADHVHRHRRGDGARDKRPRGRTRGPAGHQSIPRARGHAHTATASPSTACASPPPSYCPTASPPT